MSLSRYKLSKLKRSKALITAACIGDNNYYRRRELSRILGFTYSGQNDELLEMLLDMQAEEEAQRLSNDPFYNLSGQIDLLIALISEAQTAFEGLDHVSAALVLY